MFKLKTQGAWLLGALMLSGNVTAGLNDGLRAYYSFDDCTSKDVSGKGNHGVPHGGQGCVAGKVPNATKPTALNLTGINSYIEIPHPGYFSEGTVAGWVFYSKIPNPLPNTGLYWFGLTSENPDGIEFDSMQIGSHPYYGGNISFGIYQANSGGWHWADSGTKATTGQWQHIAGTFGENGIKIYLNGTLKGEKKYFNGIPLETRHAYLGVDAYKSFFNGKLDDIRIYNRALTQSEISTLYQEGSEVTGNIQGLKQNPSVVCVNLATKQSVTIINSSFSCERSGLLVKPKDRISIRIDGFSR